MVEMSDAEFMAELRSDTKFNRARQKFSSWSGKIDQAQLQSRALSPVELRKMEFQAVREIAKELGLELL